VVAIDPLTGGLLALVSTPSFDSNLFVNGISSVGTTTRCAIRRICRCSTARCRASIRPGSTVKPMMAMAGLEAEGLIDPSSRSPIPGWYRLPGDSRRYRDWILRIRGTGHAPEVDLQMAIAESCDVYFYDLARRMTIDTACTIISPLRPRAAHGHRYHGGAPGHAAVDALEARRPRSALVSGRDAQRRYRPGLHAGHAAAAGRGDLGGGHPRRIREPRWCSGWARICWRRRCVSRWWPRQPLGRGRRGDARGRARRTRHGARHRRGIDYEMAGKTGTAQVIGIAQDAVYDEDDDR
jgi:penicillin-binding protein 2